MKAYSQDLRDRVIDVYKRYQYTKTTISKLFKIDRHTISNWINRYKETGNYSSKQHCQTGRKIRFNDKEKILEYLAKNPDAEGIDIRNELAPSLPMSTFYDALSRMDVTYKKKEPKYKGRNEQARQSFMEQISQIAPDKLVFCDEVGVDDNITTLYGWSSRGKRSYGEREGYRSDRVSIVAGYQRGGKGLIAPMEYSGYTDTQLFVQWVEKHLCPKLKNGQYVIMDNVSFHKSSKIKAAIEKAGCTLLYLPVYSPDLNPIEHCWANFKNYLRKIIKQFDNLSTAITVAMAKTFPG